MLSKKIETKKFDVQTELSRKKKLLENLESERLACSDFFDYFKIQSLDKSIKQLEKEIVVLTEQAEKESLRFKIGNTLSNACHNLFGHKTKDQKLISKVGRHAHADEIREKYHIPRK